jgi:nidogen (entactin)
MYAILLFAALAAFASAGTQCPLAACRGTCEYGNKISEKTNCPTCGCKSEAEATPCQKAYVEAMKSNRLGNHPMKCDKMGEYKPLQHRENNYACVDKNGKVIGEWVPGPDGQKLKCKCKREKADAMMTKRVGHFIPQCEDSGHYTKMQCHGSTGYCWCVDRETGEEKSETKKGPGQGRPAC